MTSPTTSPKKPKESLSSTPNLNYCLGEESKNHFSMASSSNNGPSKFICQMFRVTDVVNAVHKTDIDMAMELFDFTSSLTRPQTEQFGAILARLEEQCQHRTKKELSLLIDDKSNLTFPNNATDLNNKLPCGKNP